MKENILSILRFTTVVCIITTLFVLYKENGKLKSELELCRQSYEKITVKN